MAKAKKKQNKTNSANLGFEAPMWAVADKLRGNMDAAEYKHVVLELIDLISTIGLGDRESRSKDILGDVYEYFKGSARDRVLRPSLKFNQ